MRVTWVPARIGIEGQVHYAFVEDQMVLFGFCFCLEGIAFGVPHDVTSFGSGQFGKESQLSWQELSLLSEIPQTLHYFSPLSVMFPNSLKWTYQKPSFPKETKS